MNWSKSLIESMCSYEHVKEMALIFVIRCKVYENQKNRFKKTNKTS